MTEKEKLYYLLKHVKIGKYDINTFCNLFTTIFDVDIDKSTLSEIELDVFGELEKYTCRFSPFEDDLKIPNAYFNEKTIRKQINVAFKRLNL